MLNIKEIALKVVVDTVNKLYDSTASYSELTEEDKKFYWTFAEALIAEIAKQNEPVESQYKGSDGSWKSFDSKDHESNTRNSGDWEVRDLFAFPPTAEQIANETAEACAGIPTYQLTAENDNPTNLGEVIDAIRNQRDELLDAVTRCYKMLLSEPDTQGALFKAENILREAIADAN